MPLLPPDSTPWSFLQWAITGVTTLFAASIAFIWRLMSRMDRLESSFEAQSQLWEAKVAASEAAMLRLAERLAQMHDDHFRVREVMSGLPSRTDMRDLEDRLIEQIGSLASRLDRALEL